MLTCNSFECHVACNLEKCMSYDTHKSQTFFTCLIELYGYLSQAFPTFVQGSSMVIKEDELESIIAFCT